MRLFEDLPEVAALYAAFTEMEKGFNVGDGTFDPFRESLEKALIAVDTRPRSTPSSAWSVNGDPDPHAGHYDVNKERADLALGNLTDDQLANGAFLNYDRKPSLNDLLTGNAIMPIVWMAAVKDRIRWLSRALDRELAKSKPDQGAA